MNPEALLLLACGMLLAAGGWTFWSANAGRKAARWGRRWTRRLMLACLFLLAAGFALRG